MENDPMCISAPPNPNPSKPCSYHVEYADDAESTGEMAYERFAFENGEIMSMEDLAFGCGFDQKGFTGKPGEPEKAAGILGLGRGKEAFYMQMDTEQIGLCFSYCFQDLLNQGGDQQPPTYLYIDDECADDTYQETPLQVMPNDPLYYVRLISIKIGNDPVTMPPVDKVIIDSGSSISLLIRPAYESLLQSLQTLLPYSWLNSKRSPPRILQPNDDDDDDSCFHKEPNQGYEILPTIHFMLEGGGDFEIQPQQGFVVLKDDSQGEVFCLMIYPHNTLSIIGAFQQVNHEIIYNPHQNKLFFTNENCALNR